MSKKCLVTGGCGFIGSNLTKKLLSEGWKVDVVDDLSSGHLELLSSIKFRTVPVDLLREFEKSQAEVPEGGALVIQGDFSHPYVLENILQKRYDVVFHQAAIPRVLFSVENPGITTDVNIASTVKLFEACRGSVRRVIFASSSSVYGGSENFPTPETELKNPKSPYAWQKSAIEDVATLFANLYDLDIVCLRYFNVFGPGQYGDSPYSTAISSWCHSLKYSIVLRSDGDGSQSRDLCYIDNAVHANILAANAAKKFKGDRYNVSCGDRIANREILDFFLEKYPHALVRDAPWRPGDVMHTQADISKIGKDLGYEPLVRFWDGLERTIDWWGLDDV